MVFLGERLDICYKRKREGKKRKKRKEKEEERKEKRRERGERWKSVDFHPNRVPIVAILG